MSRRRPTAETVQLCVSLSLMFLMGWLALGLIYHLMNPAFGAQHVVFAATLSGSVTALSYYLTARRW